MTDTKECIGIFGGSFDPPHLAHVLVVAYVLSSTTVDQVLVIPTFRHPFGKELAPYAHRLAMCEHAFADLRRVQVSNIEGQLGGESKTLHTVEALHVQQPHRTFRLILGSDLLDETARWHRFDRICDIAPPLVIPRATGNEKNPFGIPGISSTDIRDRLRTRQSLHGLLPESVLSYIDRHKLYLS